MNPVSSSKGATLLWLVFLTCSTFILASPKPPHRLEARQALASITSSAVSSTQSANVDSVNKLLTTDGIKAGAGASSNALTQTTVSSSGAGDTSPVPMVNSPLTLPSLSGCTSGDTGTVTFTSEFAHHTGLESVEEDQEFWNDTGTVWVIQVVSPGYWVQGFGLIDGNNSAPEDQNAISLDPSSSVIAITAPTHGCISKHIVSSYHHKQLASLTQRLLSSVTRPALSWSVEPNQTTSNVESTYTLSISGEYPCASNTILNSPASPSNCAYNPAVS